MKKIIFFFILISLWSQSSFSLETDNYIVWDRELSDSSKEINELFETEIIKALDQVNTKFKRPSCKTVTIAVANRFKTYPPFKMFIEDYIERNFSEDQVYPNGMSWINESIYKKTYGIFFKHIPLSPTVQVGGYYFGTDKLSHFSSTGRRYFSHYLKKLKQGFSSVEAEKSAILYGILNERTILGLKFIGVFSYGDIEANYQGFLFYKKMCMNSENNYLEQDQRGKWHLSLRPDIRDYANPFWDETYNLSYRSRSNWYKTSKIIRAHYCQLKDSPLVIERMNFYKNSPHTSFSLEFIRELQDQGSFNTPIPGKDQSIEMLCSDQMTLNSLSPEK
jgi:hypothetical protein